MRRRGSLRRRLGRGRGRGRGWAGAGVEGGVEDAVRGARLAAATVQEGTAEEGTSQAVEATTMEGWEVSPKAGRG